MNNPFSSAVTDGLKSAEHAKANTIEIRNIVSLMSAAVADTTDGKVNIKLIQDELKKISIDIFAAKIKFNYSLDLISTKNPAYSFRIAELDIPETGYPCVVKERFVEFSCKDKEALIDILRSLLASSVVGKEIIRLRDVTPTS